MKILHVNTSREGGAGIAAWRLHLGLRTIGVDSSFLCINSGAMLTPHQHAYDGPLMPTEFDYSTPDLTLSNYLQERLFGTFSSQKRNAKDAKSSFQKLSERKLQGAFQNFELFSSPRTPYDITQTSAYKETDILHLHWVANFLDYESFFAKNNKPIVWTLHDENPFMGGFHYEEDANRNAITHSETDAFFRKIKKDAISKQEKLVVVCPSKWLTEKAKCSIPFKTRKAICIRNGIDLTQFRPISKSIARQALNLSTKKTTFLFVAHDGTIYRKGLDLLTPLMTNSELKSAQLITIGRLNDQQSNSNVVNLGSVTNTRLMNLAYSAADFFILPSREDNLPNAMVESLASGTPVISFPISDNRKIIEDKECGIMADNMSSESLLDAILKAKESVLEFDSTTISKEARLQFDVLQQAGLYRAVYEELFESL